MNDTLIQPTSPAVGEWITDYTGQRLSSVEFDELVLRLDGEIVAGAPEMADPELRAELDASTRGQLVAFMSALQSDPGSVLLPPEAHALARTIARRGMDLGVLLKVYRLGQRAAQRYVADLIAARTEDPQLKTAVLLRMWESTNHWLDVSAEQLVGTYGEERERSLRGALARRSDTVAGILRGEVDDVDEASAQLGYPLRRRHTAFVLWAPGLAADDDPLARLETVAGALAERIGAPRVLVVASGGRGLWAWAGTDREPDLSSILDVLPDAEGVRVALGPTARGLAGFRRSHHDAVAAQRVAMRGVRAGQVLRYTDVEAACLVGADEPGMVALTARALGALAGDRAAVVRVRETVRVYLACHGNAEAAARALGVHKNTVRYRLQQAERLLGHPLTERRLELELAFACLDAYGPGALTPA